MRKLYTPTPDGYCGDEDNGQTSAWYVFSALGMYTVAPGTDQYILGSPLFKKATISLENGKQVVITSEGSGSDNRYVDAMSVNGMDYTKNYLTHKQLMDGADIRFRMSDKPNKTRGTKEADLPYSFSTELKQNNPKLWNKIRK